MPDLGAIGGPIVVPQCAQIIIQWNLSNAKLGHSVLYGRYNGQFAGTPAQLNAILTALTSGAQWTALAAFIASDAGIGSVEMRDVNTPNNVLITPTVGGALGTSAALALPDQVALVVTLRSAFAGKGFRGRMFTAGYAANALFAGNVVVPGCVTALGAWAGTITGILQAQGYTWSLGQRARKAYTSPTTGTAHPARAANSVPIISATVRDNHWDSQRKRGLR